MRVSIVEDHSLPGIFVRLKGSFSIDQSIEAQKRIRSLELYRDGIAILNDYTDTDVSDVSTADVMALSRVQRPGLRQRRAALVHGKELGFGLARASAMSDNLRGMLTEAFRTIAEAMAWLYPDAGLSAVPAAVDEIHTARLATVPASEAGLELFVDSIPAKET